MPSKYQTFQKKEFVRPYTIHPIWTGIGFVMIVVVLVMAGAAAALAVELGFEQKWPMMYQLSGYVRLPEILYTLPILRELAGFISSIPNLRALVLFFILFLIVFSGLVSVLYAFVYRMFGPPRYTPLDAPPPKVRAKRYKR